MGHIDVSRDDEQTPAGMMVAGCHQRCMESDVQRCVVGWADGSCGGRDQGRAFPSQLRQGPKVYQLNQCDWWAGYDLESVCAAFQRELGEDGQLENPHEVTSVVMNSMKICDDDPAKPDYRTFREELQRMVEERVAFPCFFASTES